MQGNTIIDVLHAVIVLANIFIMEGKQLFMVDSSFSIEEVKKIYLFQ